jgi:hypothetical protein
MSAPDFVADCLDRIRALPPIQGFETHGEEISVPPGGGRLPLLVSLETDTDDEVYQLAVFPIERPTRAAIEVAAEQLVPICHHLEHAGRGLWVPTIFAPHLGRELIEHAVELGLNCADAVGNAHLALENDHYIHVEGRPARKPESGPKIIRAAGYRALFGLMVEHELLNAPLREAAEDVETSVSAVKSMKEWLEAQGFVFRTRAGIEWNPAAFERLKELWLVGYQTVLRPSLVVGGLELGWHPKKLRDPEAREAEIEERLLAAGYERTWWCWGGGSAAYRIDGHYREPAVSTLHIELKVFGEASQTLRDLAGALGARPARGGMLRILDVPSGLAMNDDEDDPEWTDVAHPLLVWAEAMLSGDPRTREAAREIWRYTGFDAANL